MEGASYAQSTFSNVVNNLEKFEQAQNTPPAAAEPTPPAVTPDVPTIIDTPPAATSVPDTPPAETLADVSNFDIGIEDNEPEANAATPAQTFNWKEELKKLSFDEVVSELGFDPFAVEINKHIKGGGQAVDFLTARSVDYNKVSDEDLVKESIAKKFPDASREDINRRFNRKYGVTEDMLEDEKDARLDDLKDEGYIIRKQKIEEQQKFKIADTPVPQKDEAYESWKEQQQSNAQLMGDYRKYFEEHAATKTLNETKRVGINLGEGIAPFNFQIDKPQLLTKAMTDGGDIMRRVTATATGEPDVAKQQLITLFALNPQKVLQDIFNYGKTMGVRKELVEEGQNAQRPQAKIAQMEHSDKPTVVGQGRFSDKAR